MIKPIFLIKSRISLTCLALIEYNYIKLSRDIYSRHIFNIKGYIKGTQHFYKMSSEIWLKGNIVKKPFL